MRTQNRAHSEQRLFVKEKPKEKMGFMLDRKTTWNLKWDCPCPVGPVLWRGLVRNFESFQQVVLERDQATWGLC